MVENEGKTMPTWNYDNRTFRPVQTSASGEVTEEVLFTYRQTGNILTCTYSGGNVRSGHLIGLVDENGCIDMRYHQVNQKGELRTGTCFSKPERLPNGKIRLHETWQWTSGDGASGESMLEEVT